MMLWSWRLGLLRYGIGLVSYAFGYASRVSNFGLGFWVARLGLGVPGYAFRGWRLGFRVLAYTF